MIYDLIIEWKSGTSNHIFYSSLPKAQKDQDILREKNNNLIDFMTIKETYIRISNNYIYEVLKGYKGYYIRRRKHGFTQNEYLMSVYKGAYNFCFDYLYSKNFTHSRTAEKHIKKLISMEE